MGSFTIILPFSLLAASRVLLTLEATLCSIFSNAFLFVAMFLYMFCKHYYFLFISPNFSRFYCIKREGNGKIMGNMGDERE